MYLISGKFRELMIQSLESFKENAELLLATMEVFVHEPSMNWIKNIHNQESILKKEQTNAPKTRSEWSPRDKVIFLLFYLFLWY